MNFRFWILDFGLSVVARDFRARVEHHASPGWGALQRPPKPGAKAGSLTRLFRPCALERLGDKSLHLQRSPFVLFVTSCKKFWTALFCLSALAALPLGAQQPNPGPPATIDITFHLIEIGRTPVEPIRYATGPAASTEVELKPNQRTGPYRYRGPNPVVFFRESPGPDGKPVREPVGTLRFEKSLHQVLVFVIPRAPGSTTGDPAGAGQAELALVPIDDSRGAFAPDTLVIYNALPMRVGAVFGEKRFVVEPGASAPLPVKELGKGTIPMEFWIETTGGSKMVLGGEIDFIADNREVMVLLPPRRKGSWLIQCVRVPESMNTPAPAATRAAGR